MYFFGPASALCQSCCQPLQSRTQKTNISSNKKLFFTVLSSWSGLILSARSKVGGGGARWHTTKFPVSCRISSCLFTKNTSAWPTRWLCHPARSPRRRGDRQRCHQQVLTAPQKYDSNRAIIKSHVAVIARSRARNRLVTLPRQETPVADPAATSPPD